MSLFGGLMTRRRLMYGGYCAIAVEACGEGLHQTNICKSYLERIRERLEFGTRRELAVEINDRRKRPCKRPDCRCQLFATNAGEGIYVQPSDKPSKHSDGSKQDSITNYSFVLITDGCRQMDGCITELENELGLREKKTCMGYRDHEIRWLIDTRLKEA
jgi:hypothetical protein